MERPKSTHYVPVRMPDEMIADVRTSLVDPHNHAVDTHPAYRDQKKKSLGDAIKDCVEFRLMFLRAIHLGYWHLRTIKPIAQGQSGNTVMVDVTHESRLN